MTEPESVNHPQSRQYSESSEYIYLRHYVGDDSSQRYKLTEKAKNISLVQLVSQIDVMFEGYLQQNCEEDQYSNWQSLLEKRPLSELIKEFYSNPIPEGMDRYISASYDFNDKQILSPRKLEQALFDFASLGDLICCYCRGVVPDTLNLLEEDAVDDFSKRGTPLSIALRRAFHDVSKSLHSEFDDQHLINNFFDHYLRRNYFFEKSESVEEITKTERIRAAMSFESFTTELLTAVCCVSDQHGIQNKLIHAILKLKQTAREQEIEQLLVAAEKFDPSPANLIEQTEALLSVCAPRLFESELLKPQVKLQKITDQMFLLLPLDNFYFESDIRESDPDEWKKFPENGAFSGEKHSADRANLVAGSFDINVFDTDGHKVFWGDLYLSQIDQIKGPFYVLSSRDAYYDIPKDVVIDKLPSRDQYREEVLGITQVPKVGGDYKEEASQISASYMKAKALGMILDGSYVSNSIRIPEIL